MIQATLDLRGLDLLVERMPQQIDEGQLKAARDIGARLQGAAGAQIGPGGLLESRTGTLKRSLFWLIDVAQAGLMRIRVGFDLLKARYGRIQELGGTVTATNASFLTIPLEAAKTASGVPRYTARDVIATPTAFGYSGTFFAKGVLFGREGKGKGAVVTPLFALKRSVTLLDRAPLANTLVEQQPWVVQRVDEAVGDAIRRSTGA